MNMHLFCTQYAPCATCTAFLLVIPQAPVPVVGQGLTIAGLGAVRVGLPPGRDGVSLGWYLVEHPRGRLVGGQAVEQFTLPLEAHGQTRLQGGQILLTV